MNHLSSLLSYIGMDPFKKKDIELLYCIMEVDKSYIVDKEIQVKIFIRKVFEMIPVVKEEIQIYLFDSLRKLVSNRDGYC